MYGWVECARVSNKHECMTCKDGETVVKNPLDVED